MTPTPDQPTPAEIKAMMAADIAKYLRLHNSCTEYMNANANHDKPAKVREQLQRGEIDEDSIEFVSDMFELAVLTIHTSGVIQTLLNK